MTTTLATATGARNGSDYNAIQFFILFIILKCVCVCVCVTVRVGARKKNKIIHLEGRIIAWQHNTLNSDRMRKRFKIAAENLSNRTTIARQSSVPFFYFFIKFLIE